MTYRLRPLLAAVAALLVHLAAATAPQAQTSQTQTPPPQRSENQEQLAASVDHLAGKLTEIEKAADGARPSRALLTDLSEKATPLVAEAQGLVDRLTPRTAAVKARLDQLGPKPEKGGEDQAITKERDTLQKAFDDNDSLLKRAKVFAIKAQQDLNYIAKRQRALFAQSLFQRSASILSPPLWFEIVKETPSNLADLTRVFNAWLADFNANLTGGKLVAFWGLVTGVLLLYWPLTRLGRRFIRREARVDNPTAWQKAVVACWTGASTAGAMIAIMYAVVYVFSFFTTPEPRIMPFFSAMQWGVIRLALAAGLARGLLAPGKPSWRMVDLDDVTVEKLVRIAVSIALIASAGKIIESMNDVIGASLEFSIAARGIGALLVAASMAAALVDLGRALPGAAEGEVESADEGSQRRDVVGLIRIAAWGLILCITMAVLIGFSPFASFLVDQIVLVACVGALLFLLIRFGDASVTTALEPGSVVGRNLVHAVGMRRETLKQVTVLLTGALRLALVGLAVLVVAAPWGMQSTDVAGNVNAIIFGFKVGDVTISIAGIAAAITIFLIVLAVTRGLQNWLENEYLPNTRLDSGLRNSIRTSLGYIGVIVALSLAAANLGVDFQKLAIVAGALSVGIGFGLQSIVNNFVSGLILLWERAVRVGDWIVVGSDQGYVRKINVRSTEIETFDRAAVIVPNSNLVSGVVKNLMRTDRTGRISIELAVHPTADPEKVREVLLDIARDRDGVLSLPSPKVFFMNLTSTAMTFNLLCFVSDVDAMARTKSDLYFEISRRFRQHGFFDGPAPPPTAIELSGLDRLEDALKAVRSADIGSLPTRKTA